MNSPLRVLLVNTYDLGRQSFGLASSAAWLRSAGHDVTCLDLAVQPLDSEAIDCADLIAVHVPMHTATRLAERVYAAARERNPAAHLCAFGLYAEMNAEWLRGLGVRTALAGEFEPGLVALAERVSGEGHAPLDGTGVSLDRLSFQVPDRTGLPPLTSYARLMDADGESRVVGATEASRGCKHRCRHCPIVPVYDGRFRIVQRDVVLADIRQMVGSGARHITFGDPDFFNGIGHAIPLIEAFHAEHPDVSYDVTIKVEHLLRHAEHLATLRDTGCAFVTSAVESIDDDVLEILDKGHTRADFLEVVRLFRQHDLNLNPTFVAFSPWTTLEGYRDLLECLADLGLDENIQSVQLAIRLLVPRGSRLLEVEDLARRVGPFDPQLLVHPWRHDDPRVDALQLSIEQMVAAATARGETRLEIFDRARRSTDRALGEPRRDRVAASERPKRAPVPYLSEPWYC